MVTTAAPNEREQAPRRAALRRDDRQPRRRAGAARAQARDDLRHGNGDADGYLLKYRPCLRYDEYLATGLPISTGVIEGACRHLVKDRMDITGACWGLRGAEAVLKLRSLRASGDLDANWAFHENADHVRNHLDLHANAPPPTVMPLKVIGRAHLRLVR